MFLFFILLVIAILLEGTIVNLPLVLICLLCLTILKKDSVVFLTAFFSGIFLDIFKLHIVGQSSIFFIIFIFFVLLYQRKYEINSYPFVAASGFFGALIYSLLFGYSNWLLQATISGVVALLLFVTLRLSQKSKVKIQN